MFLPSLQIWVGGDDKRSGGPNCSDLPAVALPASYAHDLSPMFWIFRVDNAAILSRGKDDQVIPFVVMSLFGTRRTTSDNLVWKLLNVLQLGNVETHSGIEIGPHG